MMQIEGKESSKFKSIDWLTSKLTSKGSDLEIANLKK